MDCNNCIHLDVCKYLKQFGDYKEKISEISVDFGLPFKANIECSKYQKHPHVHSAYTGGHPFKHADSLANSL